VNHVHNDASAGTATTIADAHVAKSVANERRHRPRKLLAVDPEARDIPRLHDIQLGARSGGLLRDGSQARLKKLEEIRLLEMHRDRGL
jgi:hypothetical protein